MSTEGKGSSSRARRTFRFLLRLFPFDFQRDYGRDLEQVLRDEWRDADSSGREARRRFWTRALADALRVASREQMAVLWADVAYAFRMMRRNLGVTALAILTLSIGISATTAVFSVANGILLRPLPYDEPDRLAVFRFQYPRGWQYFISAPTFTDFRDSGIFEELACISNYSDIGFDLTGEHAPIRVSAMRTSSGFFKVLGVRPILGRAYTRDEETANQALVVLSYGLWQRQFGGRFDILGRTLLLGGEGHEIIGVLPAGFDAPLAGDIDVWMPHNLEPGDWNTRGNNYLSVMGRLPKGAALEETQAAVDRFYAALAAEYPELNPETRIRLIPLHEDLVGSRRPILLTLLGAVAFVLLIACVNVANITLARGSSRRKELSIRTALGAGRARLIRQLATESLTLAGVACGFGAALAYTLVQLILAWAPMSIVRGETIVFDNAVFAFTVGISLAAGIVFGIIPAVQLSGVNPNRFLAENGRTGESTGARRMRNLLVATETALALVLLVGAGLLVQSLQGLLKLDTGIHAANVWTYVFNLPDSRYPDPEQRVDFYRRYFDRMESLPGVGAAGAVSRLPLTGRFHDWGIRIEGAPLSGENERSPNANMRCVDGHYFQAMGIGLVEGRLFESTDVEDAPPVILVNRELARRYLHGDALGRRLRVNREWWTIAGVVEDVLNDQRETAVPMIYYSHAQFADNRNWVLTQVVATEPQRRDVAAMARRELAALDSGVVIHDVRPMDQVVTERLARERFSTALMTGFSVVALLLAAVGIYGVLSYSVSRRTREIGVRMALGAAGHHVRGWVMLQGLIPVLIGATTGMAGALTLTHFLQSLLFGVAASDISTLAGTAGLLLVTAVLAAYVPARRATRVDPMTALRTE